MAPKPPPGGTVELGHVGQRATIRRFALRVVDGPEAGKVFPSTGPRMVVGSDSTSDAALSDRTVSRFHAELRLDGGLAVIRDLESRNGTRVETVPIREALLEDKATITVGQTRLRFELGAEELGIPLSRADRFGLMVGSSVAMRAAFATLEKAAAAEAVVLLEGETGTGKDVAAESIHLESPRKNGPFVVVDCGAIPGPLLESELFGHERGAFTGAVDARAGAFEAANGGTIFLDELGELDLELQPKLLRVLERRTVKRVGGTEQKSVDVRVIAATNRDLRAEVNAKRFRADLYYRLAVLSVRLPPLRERLDDLPGLIAAILDRLGARAHPYAPEILGPAFLQAVRAHSWPGNVRELRNYVERCLTLYERPPLEAEGAEPAPGAVAVDVSLPIRDARQRVVDAFERRYLTELLAKEGGNVTRAARAAGVDRVHFYRMMWRHGLK